MQFIQPRLTNVILIPEVAISWPVKSWDIQVHEASGPWWSVVEWSGATHQEERLAGEQPAAEDTVRTLHYDVMSTACLQRHGNIRPLGW